MLVEEEPILPWRLMASAYNTLKQPINAEYAMVEYNLSLNKVAPALASAKKLMKKMPKDNPHYQRLQDIIALADKKD